MGLRRWLGAVPTRAGRPHCLRRLQRAVAHQRHRSYQSRRAGPVLIGSSRIRFDLDWASCTGTSGQVPARPTARAGLEPGRQAAAD